MPYLYEEPGEEVLLELEPYLGLRAWRIMDGALHSVHHPHQWPVGKPLEATCDVSPRGMAAMFARSQGRPAHDPPYPALTCQCGVYAVKLDLDLLELVTLGSESSHVLGLVKLWGQVIEHENGYRAQFAQPASLWEANVVRGAEKLSEEDLAKKAARVLVDHFIVAAVAQRYGVPLTKWGSLAYEPQ